MENEPSGACKRVLKIAPADHMRPETNNDKCRV